MRRVRVTQPRADCLEIQEGRAVVWAIACAVGVGALAGLLSTLTPESRGWTLVWVASVAMMPVLAVQAMRALKATTRSLVRTPGRLLLDGEPLELARVELRVTHLPLTSVPTGFALSLWMMTATGPEDLPLGRFTSMLQAAPLSGMFEEFVARASVKQPGRTPT